MIPTIEQIRAATRRSTQTSPRPSRAFWLAACRLLIEPDPEQPSKATLARAFCDAHEWPIEHGYQATALRHLEPLGEADLRAAFVELSILGSENEDAARMVWAEALDIRDEDGGPW